MFGTWALVKPGAELPIDLLLVGSGRFATEVLAHQPNPAIDEIEREPKPSGGGRRGRHPRNCNAHDRRSRRPAWGGTPKPVKATGAPWGFQPPTRHPGKKWHHHLRCFKGHLTRAPGRAGVVY